MTMYEFTFEAPEKVHRYAERIADEMAEQTGISTAEAVARVNEHWDGVEFEAENDLIFHELPYYWALRIYYTDVPDWRPDADRSAFVAHPAPARDSGFWTKVDD
jgi:hypothetical protein